MWRTNFWRVSRGEFLSQVRRRETVTATKERIEMMRVSTCLPDNGQFDLDTVALIRKMPPVSSICV